MQTDLTTFPAGWTEVFSEDRPTSIEALSPREIEVLRAMACGERAYDTARRFGTSIKTVKAQRYSLIKKLGAKNAPHAVTLGFIDGILDLDS